MEPIRQDKPGIGTFLLMTLIFFAVYFGSKYGIFGGQIGVLWNVLLIAVSLGLALLVRRLLR
jgi:hypothetical protein